MPASTFPSRILNREIGNASKDSIVFFSRSPAKEVETNGEGAITAIITDKKPINPAPKELAAPSSPGKVIDSFEIIVALSTLTIVKGSEETIIPIAASRRELPIKPPGRLYNSTLGKIGFTLMSNAV